MYSLSRRSLIATAAAVAATPASWAQSGPYPNRPLSLVVPYPAGGPSDAAARIFAEAIGKDLKQPVIVENIGGGTGVIGANKVLGAAPDGYTFFHGSVNEVILAPLLNEAAKYKSTDFKFAQPTTEATIVLLVRNGLNINTLDEFIAYAQKNKDKPLSFATVGIDSLYHLMGEAMAKRTGANFLHVPYKGSAPALQDLAGGQVDFAILAYQVSMDGMAQQGRLKLLTSFSKNLPPTLKHIPKIDASKQLPDFEHTIGGGYLVRKDTPGALVDRLRVAVGHALQQADVRARLEAEGRTVLLPLATQAQADAYLVAQVNRYIQLLKDVGRQPVR
ncbi:tripartite tricarboxylate transporter substrate binding protein [Polaromonas sp. SM01]|uniref:tripartite tricarboxylate transporter substrate binding protein n=1 Tax=Polaromonas sp. SM01 TaxID=3085630 RepID=UPI002980EB4F|nr:tripartite tricarboxylate transporter substrate binding protein [Polaromonas sp. SM01]MDW5444916.1 tripartite tricarboxylate transporter substrate binding protein [Polaromonas sp. SM01]